METTYLKAITQGLLEEMARDPSVYVQEPNVKESAGGLRDFQSVLWLSRAFGAKGFDDIAKRGWIPGEECRGAREAYDFLLRLRAQLHILAGAKNDMLTFDAQAEAAGDGMAAWRSGRRAPPANLVTLLVIPMTAFAAYGAALAFDARLPTGWLVYGVTTPLGFILWIRSLIRLLRVRRTPQSASDPRA